MNLEFGQTYEKYDLKIKPDNGGMEICLEFPVRLYLLGGRCFRVKYDTVEETNGIYEAKARIHAEEGYVLEVTDRWKSEGNRTGLDRKVRCCGGRCKRGFRMTSEFRVRDESAGSFDDYGLVFPGAFYNKNDTDGDGRDDYLGTFEQDYKDDRNPGLSETLWCQTSKRFLSLIRADVPKTDSPIDREQIRQREFVQNTQIGSLGFSPSPYRADEVVLRTDYPFCERNSFCLNVDGSGWAAYRQMEEDEEMEISYLLFTGDSGDLTEAAWKTTVFQMDRIMEDDIRLPFTLEESMSCRRELTNNSYREFPDKEGKPAGYFVHFSPRGDYGKQNILEYGFSGQQQMLSYVMLLASKELASEEHRRRALRTLDFFCEKCVHPSGIPYGLYDVDREKYIFWWTGVLFPFQYSHDRRELEAYLGKQVVSAILPIADELKKNDGNYTRTMIDAMYYLWLCYQTERKNGTEQPKWRTAVINFCDKLLELQNENGSWNRAYTMEGKPLTSPKQWFGCNELEQGSGVIFPVEVLSAVYEETGEEKYRAACEKASDFILKFMVENVAYVGGLNDTTHKKSVKIDAVGVMFAMRSLLRTFEITREKKYLLAAEKAAKVLASWTYLWDIPFCKGTVLGDHGFCTTGWTGCDVIPACSYVDDEFAEFVPDVLRIANYTNNLYLAKLAKIVFLGMQHGLSTGADMYGYKMAGVQCEGYMTSLWLSDTQNPEFSGAVAKLKGDDNDTCNGLINGQQLATMHELLDTYGTMDMDKIIEKVITN